MNMPISQPAIWFKRSKQVPHIELRQNWRTTSCFDLHSHQEYSIGLIDEGAATYQLHQTSYAIRAQDIVTIDNNAVHSCNPSTAHWSYRMLFIEPALLHALFPESLQHFRFKAAYQRQAQLVPLFDALFNALVQEESRLVVESQLVSLCEHLFVRRELAKVIELAGLKKVRMLLQEQSEADFCLQDLSALAALEPYQLVRHFKKAYGLPPHAFQLDQRIQKAKALLRQGQPLSQVALDLGFADQAHFQRHFKRRLALTPKAYQQCFTA